MDNVTLAIECESDAADSLAIAQTEASRGNVTRAEKNSLDGSLPTVLQIMQIVVSLATAVTPIVTGYIASKKVKKIKFGEIEIENPTREQWERLWTEYVSQ